MHALKSRVELDLITLIRRDANRVTSHSILNAALIGPDGW